ncbi:MAG: amidase [Steroidobacteraceae bacterium]
MSSALAAELPRVDATALAQAIRSRSLTAVEVVAAHFERIKSVNHRFNALVSLDERRALQRAREADEDLATGKVWGPLHGVPVTIKDSFDTAGLRTTVGSWQFRDFVPMDDAWVVSRLKHAGAIIIGKTNCAKLCGDVQTTNEVFGRTRNPWDAERTAGGSSGGEAAAVALGMSPLGIGSDTAGSIRIPASYCGVFGLKTSLGKVGRSGLRPLHDADHRWQDTLTVIGPIARSLRDLLLCYEVLTGESREGIPSATGPRVHWTQEFESQVVDDQVSATMSATFSALVAKGVDVAKVPSPIPFGKLLEQYARLCLFEFTPKENGKALYYLFWLSEAVRSMFRGGTTREYGRLKQFQADLSSNVRVFMDECDCWVLPATPSVAFSHCRVGWPVRLTANGRSKCYGYWAASMGFTFPFNMTGNPSVVMPIGTNKEGLPIAMQIVGKQGEDLKLLASAAYVAEKLGSRASAERAREPPP